ncbi:unnamed protein product [Cylicocyclus nassatus]|uniref:ShKT domain-containing protein n=1 Tax=Cylicocyclus nassatus TaxID=53992 RepID=A0AA36H3N0_CYLNA|nr:unnamed protein product [Cylicocyclus nassatus]
MLFVLFVLAGLATPSNADFTPDFNCTEVNATAKTVLTAASVNCDDKYSADTCADLFGTAVKAGDDKRDPKCNMISSAFNEELKNMAVASCPKHCGYCCQTPEYDCVNKQFPRTNCDTVKPDQCKDPKWRPILAEDCPHTCGLCLESNGCIDAVIECKNDLSICRNIDMQDFVKPHALPPIRVNSVLHGLRTDSAQTITTLRLNELLSVANRAPSSALPENFAHPRFTTSQHNTTAF